MRKIYAVIGAQWGDCGKGLVTDFLSHSDTLVVRYNGSCQAGHTVVTPEGLRHVFHHIGSGALVGASTFLSQYFILNPISFAEEIATFTIKPKVIAAPFCLVATPYDMMLNRAVEQMRGDKRHGSCGWGVHETLRRSAQFPLLAFHTDEIAKETLQNIYEIYVPQRAKELELDLASMPFLHDKRVIDGYLDDLHKMKWWITLASFQELAASWRGDILFEGAQGLQLDQDNWQFPHVTPSKTGLYNILDLLKQGGISETLEAFYVTRSYITRHGAGPMPHNLDMSYVNIVDETNVENSHQGKMNFSWLDLSSLEWAIRKEKEIAEDRDVNFNLVMTCLDQLKNGVIHYVDAKNKHISHVDNLLEKLRERLKFKGIWLSTGAARNHVSKY